MLEPILQILRPLALVVSVAAASTLTVLWVKTRGEALAIIAGKPKVLGLLLAVALVLFLVTDSTPVPRSLADAKTGAPAWTDAPASRLTASYVIQPRDTLAVICCRYGINQQTVKDANQIRDDGRTLKQGETILIPLAAWAGA